MTKLSLLVLTAVCAAISLTNAKDFIEAWEKEYLKMGCKGESLDHDKGIELMRKNCKDAKDGLCFSSCYYKQIGLYDDNYRLYTDPKKTVSKMVKSGVFQKKVAEMYMDIAEESGCAKKAPKGDSIDCKKAKKTTVCLILAFSKACGLGVEKKISGA